MNLNQLKKLNKQHIDNDFKLSCLAAKRSGKRTIDGVIVVARELTTPPPARRRQKK